MDFIFDLFRNDAFCKCVVLVVCSCISPRLSLAVVYQISSENNIQQGYSHIYISYDNVIFRVYKP